MATTRRTMLKTSLTALGGLGGLGGSGALNGLARLGLGGAAGLAGASARAAAHTGGDTYATGNGAEMTVHPVQHASFVLETPAGVVYVDPIGGAGPYEGLPAPDLVLITHEHGDHFDFPTLGAIVGENTRLVTNPAVHGMLPEAMRELTEAIGNGESTEAMGIGIEAIPAYNLTEERLQFHPEGRDNGYVLSIDGSRVYVSGDTEAVPEMRALTDIDLAFVCMNLPYTMAVTQAAEGVLDFAPAVVYPYHYRDSDPEAFATLVAEGDERIEVVQGPWYA